MQKLDDKDFRKLVKMGQKSKIVSKKDKRIAFELIN